MIPARDTAASGNGLVKDVPVLALAWIVEADVRTTDRNFVGTDVARWSMTNLMRTA